MNKIRIATLIIVLLFATNVFAKNVKVKNNTSGSTREMLEALGNFDNDQIEAMIGLLNEKIEIDEIVVPEVSSANSISPYSTSYIDSDNWQVVRIIAVASEDHQFWEEITEYDTITSIDHGGDWLVFATIEQAFQPLNGLVDASATFRYWNATEDLSMQEDLSDGIYQITLRYWIVPNTFSSGEIQFEADYAQQVGYNFNSVHLHRELDVR